MSTITVTPIRTRAALAVAAVALVASVAFAATARPASAQDQGSDGSTLTWSVRPTPVDGVPDRPNFSGHEVAAGGTVTDSIRIRNFGDGPLPLAVYATDAVVTPAGELTLLPADEPATDVGTWVKLDVSSVVVPPGETVDVPFRIEVPDNAESGDHSGGIVTSFVDQGHAGGEPVLLDRRLASRLHVRVTGDLRPELEITDVEASYAGTANPLGAGTLRLSYTVTNVGNVRMGADQVVEVGGLAGLFGREVQLEAMEELIVGSSRTFTVEVPDVWPTLRTKVEVELTPFPTRDGDEFDADVLTASTSVSVWTPPWSQVVLLVVIAALVVGVRWRRRQLAAGQDAKVKAAVDAALAATAQEPDN